MSSDIYELFLISEVFVLIMCIQYNDKIILIKSYDRIELR
jgi:hypothetical protein